MGQQRLYEGIELAERNNIELSFDDARVYATYYTQGKATRINHLVRLSDNDMGHAVYAVVLRALQAMENEKKKSHREVARIKNN